MNENHTNINFVAFEIECTCQFFSIPHSFNKNVGIFCPISVGLISAHSSASIFIWNSIKFGVFLGTFVCLNTLPIQIRIIFFLDCNLFCQTDILLFNIRVFGEKNSSVLVFLMRIRTISPCFSKLHCEKDWIFIKY